MKIKTVLLLITFNCTYNVFAENTNNPLPENIFNHTSIGFLGAYTDFTFDSTAGTNFNRFKGHSKLYSLGAGNIQITPTWTTGVALFKVDTQVSSQLFLDPGIPANSNQSTHNSTLFGHALKQLTPSIFVDLAAAYGQNKVNTQVALLPNSPAEKIGYAATQNNNWFASITGLYSKPWKKFIFTTNGRLLYSQIDAGSYFFTFQPQLPAQRAQPLTNKVLFLMENVELGYNVDAGTMPWSPFINAGLLQVLSFSNSRPVIGSPINGVSPQLSLDKNGYRFGGGLSFRHKQLTLRIEEQYYNASQTYISYQTLLSVKYAV